MEDNERVSLVNKAVRTISLSDKVDNTGLVSFMYPDFIIRDELFFNHNDNVIYMGKYSTPLRKEIESGTKNFIAISNSGMYDIDFTNRDTMIRVLYSKWDKQPSSEFRKVLDSMSPTDFIDFFKKFWVLGSHKHENIKVTMFSLYKLFGKQNHDILKVYYQLREVYSSGMIFSSTLNFIEKALNPEMVSSQSGGYVKLLESFNREFGDSIRPILLNVYKMPCETEGDRDYRTLWLLMQLGKGNII